MSFKQKEAEAIQVNMRQLASKSLDELDAIAADLLRKIPELSWFNKPLETAVLLQLYRKGGIINEALFNRVVFTLADISVLRKHIEAMLDAGRVDYPCHKSLVVNKPHVAFFSVKFGDFLSSQEYFLEILKRISLVLNVTLISDRTISGAYKGLFRCFEGVNLSGLPKLSVTENFTHIADLSRGHWAGFQSARDKVLVVDPHGMPMADPRLVDAQLVSREWRNFNGFFNRPASISSELMMFVPPESNLREYPPIAPIRPSTSRVVFGAFCRTAKLNAQTVSEWAKILIRHPDSEIRFAFFQSNQQSEVFVQHVFSRLGVARERVSFLPRVGAGEYLDYFNDVTIVLGAMPEQGGVSCMDALMMGCCYVVCEELSNTLVASDVLYQLGLGHLSAESIPEYHALIDRLVIDRDIYIDTEFRENLRQRLLTSSLSRADAVSAAWIKFFLNGSA